MSRFLLDGTMVGERRTGDGRMIDLDAELQIDK
jgi:hypothetical protein